MYTVISLKTGAISTKQEAGKQVGHQSLLKEYRALFFLMPVFTTHCAYRLKALICIYIFTEKGSNR